MIEIEYALYKGETLLYVGTIEEIANFKGVKKSSVLHLLSAKHLERLESSKRGNLLSLYQID